MAVDENGVNRGGWDMGFDDFKRKMRTKDIELKKLMTTYPGTDDYEAYMALFLSDDNTGKNAIEVRVADDNRTTTFYIIVPHTKADTFMNTTGTNTTKEQK